MDSQKNQAMVRDIMERGFGQGDLSVIDQYHISDTIDHQEPLGTDFVTHLKVVITNLRTAFPDLHFEIHDIVSEGETVAFRSTMTGTHLGSLQIGPTQPIPATGRRVSVPHMHFLRVVNGRTVDLWHLWNTALMMQQLGIAAESRANTPR